MNKKALSWILSLAMVLSLFAAMPLTAAAAAFSGGSGTELDPYLISTAADLEELATNVNSGTSTYANTHFKMTNDIAVGYWQDDGDGIVEANEIFDQESGGTLYTASNYTSIGTINYFSGTFNGDGHTVSGIYIDETVSYQGLFGHTEYAAFTDVGIVNSYIQGDNCTGGVVGYTFHCTIDGCYNTSSVSGRSYVGGVVGQNDIGSTLKNSYNTGNVSNGNPSNNNYQVGGVTGYNAGTIDNCYNTGSVSSYESVGGIAGDNRGTIKNSYNSGSVAGAGQYAGGVAGYNTETIDNGYNTGSISGGSHYTGGIVGRNYYGTLRACYNAGSVYGTGDYVGGVAGSSYGTTENCYNTGGIGGGDYYVGGVVGAIIGCAMQYCYNSGGVSGVGYVGGIVGYAAHNCTMDYCYNSITDQLSGTTHVGGVAGYLDDIGTFSYCYYDDAYSGTGFDDGSADETNCIEGKMTAEMQGESLKTDETGDGWTGEHWIFSDNLYPRLLAITVPVPYATDVSINGVAKIGETLTGSYTYHSDNALAESGTTYRWLRSSGSSQQIDGINSIFGVSNNPPKPSILTIPEDSFITSIHTYHYYNNGHLPGTIALKEIGGDGTVYGPWAAVGTLGQGGVVDANWYVYPNINLPAGDYQVIDSDPATWSWASDTDGRGIANIYGEGYTPIEGATGQSYTLSSADGGHMIRFEVTVQDSSGQTGLTVCDTLGPIVLSTDASLSTVLSQTITAGTEAGTSGEPKTASISVASSVSSVAATDITAATGATVTFYGTDSTFSIVEAGSVPLTAGGDTIVYIKVTAEDTTTTLYYAVTITRAAASGGGGGTTITYYSITASAGNGGSIDPSGSVSVQKNLSKTFSITPESGYVIADVLVDGVSVGAVTEYTFSGITEDHTITASFEYPSSRFTDVDGSLWYREGIDFVLTAGLFNGTSDTTFEPNTEMTRAMLVTVLWRLDNEPDTTLSDLFADIAAGTWYTDAVAWASEAGVVEGYDADTFGPDDSITREQMAAILYRYASYKGYDVTAMDDLSGFDDAGDTSEWALTAMQWAVAEGLIQGVGGNQLDPAGHATRAQVATILMRFVHNIVE